VGLSAQTKRRRLAGLRQLAADRGGQCLARRYTGVQRKYRWQCANGHTWSATPTRIREGRWCPHCHLESARNGLGWLQDLAGHHGGECRSKTYRTTETRYEWRCAQGHDFTLSGRSVADGGWCPRCRDEGNGRATGGIDHLREVAREQGIECLSRRYVDSHTRYRWRCPAGHTWRARYSVIREGRVCPQCAPAKTRKAWTDAEDAILLRYYPKETRDIVKRLPGRTLSAVRGRFFQLQRRRRAGQSAPKGKGWAANAKSTN